MDQAPDVTTAFELLRGSAPRTVKTWRSWSRCVARPSPSTAWLTSSGHVILFSVATSKATMRAAESAWPDDAPVRTEKPRSSSKRVGPVAGRASAHSFRLRLKRIRAVVQGLRYAVHPCSLLTR